jgi:hypothetical protein
MQDNTLNLESLDPATKASAAAQIAAACGLKATDLVVDRSDLSFGDETEPESAEAAVQEEDQLLQPEEIIRDLQSIGPKVALAKAWTRSCVAELQSALRLVRGAEGHARVRWRIKGAPVFLPTAAEKAERLELLLSDAFSCVTSMITVCAGAKGYDAEIAARLARIEASLERFGDSPEIFKEAALALPAEKKTTRARSFNR